MSVTVMQRGAFTREVLQAARTYYVRSDGSGSNNGLANTSGGAFSTLAQAVAAIMTLDLAGFTVTIKIGNTVTLTGNLSFSSPPVGGNVVLEGDTVTPANTVVSVTSDNAIAVSCPMTLTVQYVEVRTTTAGSGIITNGGGAKIIVGAGVRFGACANHHTYAQVGGYIQMSASYTISGNAQFHHFIELGGSIISGGGITATASGSRAFTTFCYVSLNGTLNTAGNTYSGTFTGQRYAAALSGAINTNGGGANYFPGNVAGSTATGGQYA